jgi:Fe-S-cluster containining protein
MTQDGGGRGSAWYGEGLRFECTQCGRCCTGGSGFVWLNDTDIVAIARHLGLSLDEFGRRHVRQVGARYALLESPADGACVFLSGDRCAIYDARPAQCRRFPFWDGLLASADRWHEAANECEGIRPDAPLVDHDRIEAIRRS